ncbi:MAG: c-type cytochrome [Piscinibacter sp.]|nr:c-type cytochrome [Piscinibacter sp.]
MRTWIIRIVFALVALLACAALGAVALASYGERKARRHVELTVAAVAIPTEATAIERGRYLFRSRGCADCHGIDGTGHDVVNDGKGLHVRAPAITPHPDNAVARYADVDWVRTIRHGVAPGGRPLLIMPSEDYNRFTDADVGALIAYLRQLPPLPGAGALIELPLPVRALYGAGVIRDAAAKIDHSRPPSVPVPEAVTPEHGAYVANTCIGCHGAGLAGGRIPGAPPDWPAAANLTPGSGSAMTTYADVQAFVSMMRSGRRPDGSAVSPVMPFAALKEMNDTDLQALYLHLKRLPPRDGGTR